MILVAQTIKFVYDIQKQNATQIIEFEITDVNKYEPQTKPNF